MFATEDHSRDIVVSGYYSYTGYGLELKTAYPVSVLDIYATLNGCYATFPSTLKLEEYLLMKTNLQLRTIVGFFFF